MSEGFFMADDVNNGLKVLQDHIKFIEKKLETTERDFCTARVRLCQLIEAAEVYMQAAKPQARLDLKELIADCNERFNLKATNDETK